MDEKSPSNFYSLSTSDFLDGKIFDMKGETAQSVANGHKNVTDLEVYLVKGQSSFISSINLLLSTDYYNNITLLIDETKKILAYFFY